MKDIVFFVAFSFSACTFAAHGEHWLGAVFFFAAGMNLGQWLERWLIQSRAR